MTGVSLVLFFVTPVAYGQGGIYGSEVKEKTREEIREVKSGTRETIRDYRTDKKEDVKDLRRGVKEEAAAVRGDSKGKTPEERQELLEELKTKRETARKEIEDRREEFHKSVEEKREAAKGEIEKKREELKDRLKTIKDDRKKKIIERVAEEIHKLNERQMEHFSNVLDKLEKILERIDSRADKAEANGRDVAAVRTKIIEAQAAIDAAKAAVAVQAGKTYDIQIGDENALRQTVGEARQALHRDIAVVRELVVKAREAVKAAATALAQIPRVDELEVEGDDL